MIVRNVHILSIRILGGICFALIGLSGCLSPITLERSLVAYDHAIANSLATELLLNIARSHRHEPVHFTAVSNIAATFDFRVNAGATPPLGGLTGGGDLSPVFGASIAENPTISIVPIEGEEFTKRLLTPLRESKLTLLLRQGTEIDLLLRLMAAQLRVPKGKTEIVYYNRPTDREGYKEFRQAVLHLSALQDRNQLYVEPLVIEKTWKIPVASITGEGFRALEEQYQISSDEEGQNYVLTKQVAGRMVITNYDPGNLSNAQRIELNKKASRWPPNDLSVDIRPEFPGGEFPLQGNFRLRSFHNILNFLGRTIEAEKEYAVEPHPETGEVRENPIQTIEIQEFTSKPDDAVLTVKYKERYYAIFDDGVRAWNREAFRLLYQLYQMTVTDVPRVGAPSITIAK